MRLFTTIAWFHFITYFAYPLELIASILMPLLKFGILVLFWSIVAASSQGDLQFRQLTAYFLLTSGVTSLIMFRQLKFGALLSKEIKRGRLSQILIKPVNPLTFEYARVIGDQGILFIIATLFLLFGLILQPPASLLGLALFVLILPFSMLISLSFNILIGTIAFYTTESGGIRNVSKHVIDVLSGSLVPLYLFSDEIESILTNLPFAAAVYGPVKILQTTTLNSDTLQIILISIIWSILLFVTAVALWRKGLRKYEAVGI